MAVFRVVVTFLPIFLSLVTGASTYDPDELSCQRFFERRVCKCDQDSYPIKLKCGFGDKSSIVIRSADRSSNFFCDSLAPYDDYQFLSRENLFLNKSITDVKFHSCSLPKNLTFLMNFLNQSTLGKLELDSIVGSKERKQELSLEGLDVTTLRITSLFDVVISGNFLKPLISLKDLSIHDTNVTLYSDSFDGSQQLETLKLSSTGLIALPDRLLYKLTNLTTVSFRDNLLDYVPETIFKNCHSITSLNLGSNRFRKLPDKVFENLSNLRVLNLDRLLLESVSGELFNGLTSLRELNLRSSMIGTPELPSTLFRGLGSLQVLDMSFMGLEKLPDTLLSDLFSLEKLILSNNKLVFISSETLAPLKSLKFLYLNFNPIGEIPFELSFSEKLSSLSVQGAKLKSIPNNFLQRTLNFSELILKNNSITTLNVDAFRAIARSVTKIDLSLNKISNKHWYRAFRNMIELKTLILDSNQITTISTPISLISSLKTLSLNNNKLGNFNVRVLNFIGNGVEIHLKNNSISHIPVDTIVSLYGGRPTQGSAPNTFFLSNNPLECDCRAYSLRKFFLREGKFGNKNNGIIYELFNIKWDYPLCASPPQLKNTQLKLIDPDLLLCPYESCPLDCACQLQISRGAVQMDCSTSVVPNPGHLLNMYKGESMPELRFSMKAKGRSLRSIENFLRNFTGNLTSLDLSFKNITMIDVGLLPPYLESLRLDHNKISRIPEEFVNYLRRLSGSQRVFSLSLAHNPLVCDCALLPFYNFMFDSVSSGFKLTDLDQLTCSLGDAGTPTYLTELVRTDLCPGHMSTIVTTSVTMALISCGLLAAALAYYRHGDMIRVWLYTHRLCLFCVSEEKLDMDREYDAFISFAHQDEKFVVDDLVPQLETGEPSFSLCLHYRDWLAGEWITDQIQRSVASSRRVIVVMSQNFVDSEWGRLEFIAAHKQALADHTNRLIVILYGPMPDVSHMEKELQLYLTMNTYLHWGDPYFWQRLRYAMPHRRNISTNKLGKVCVNSSVVNKVVGDNEELKLKEMVSL